VGTLDARVGGMLRLLLVMVLVACTTNDETLDLSGPVELGKGDGSCPIVPAGIAPTGPSPYWCGPLDNLNTSLAADVNRFWGSQVVSCGCGPDFPSGCDGAFALGVPTGYIYIGVPFITGLEQTAGLMPAQYAYAHEFGHEIMGRFYGRQPTLLQKELSADCMAGYYLGSRVCRGLVNEQEVATTLALACVIADGNGSLDLDSHGTCEQRVKSVTEGMRAYLTGQPPLPACAL
jgi:hypothetical protein